MTATCNLYADMVKLSLETAVQLGHDYYHHVCSGWLRRHQGTTLLALRESFRDVDAPDLKLDGSTVWQSIVEQDAASVNHGTWRIALAELFGIGQDPDVQVVIRNPGIVKQVFHLPSLLSHERFALSVGWMMVQLLSLVANQEVVVHVLSGGYREDTEAAQLVACFDLVRTTMRFALNADYVNQVATRATLNDVAVIVRRVNQNIREQVRLSPDIEDIKVPSYDNETGDVFRYLEKSTDAHLGRKFSAFTDISPVLHILSRGFTQVLEPIPSIFLKSKWVTRRVMLSAIKERSYREELDFTLMAYALAFPVYEADAPLSFKYGSRGSVVGTSLAELFFANGSWTEVAEERLHHAITCFLGHNKNSSSLSLLEWDPVFMFTSVQATWWACRVAQTNHGLEHIKNLPDMSGAGLFFVWCYLKCGDAFGEYACNVPLSHSLAFAEAYNF
ncbi:hypothetical protein HPB49_022890 [Dermacentor silvarum]|uniref:Uncharacterized protein n=1 Tax=Dermacentor silvarum TaxID=543639 RepID=A0ACB8E3S5_DERSI|nr:hypothetical protein HPB49_022890 [Dermacentor silvarum]